MIAKTVLLFLNLGFVLSADTTPVKRCGGMKENMFQWVTISTPEGICKQPPCRLVAGADVKADISFTVKEEVTKIKMYCNATAMGVTVNYPIPQAEEGCNKLTNTYCPIEADTEAQLEFKMNILNIFPKVNVNLLMYFLNQNDEMIMCFQVEGKVVKKNRLFEELEAEDDFDGGPDSNSPLD